MSLSYYHNVHAKYDFEENQNKLQRCNHRRDKHKRKYEIKNEELVLKTQSLIGYPPNLRQFAIENIRGQDCGTNIILWTKFYFAHHIYI